VRVSSVATLCLGSLLGTCIVAACGSNDEKKSSPRYQGGGEGGGGPSAQAGSAADAGAGTTRGGADGVAGDAGSGDGGVGASAAGNAGSAGDTGGAGGAPTLPFHGLYIGEDGNDAAAGTADDPFATLSHAASVAQLGGTIVFLDGSYDTKGPSIVIPSGVSLTAANRGLATIVGANGSLLSPTKQGLPPNLREDFGHGTAGFVPAAPRIDVQAHHLLHREP